MPTKKKTRKKATARAAVRDPREPIAPTGKTLDSTVAEVRAVLAKTPPPDEPEQADLVHALVHIVFAEGLSCGHGQEVVRRVEESFVDRNEFRVTEAFEVAELLDDLEIPDCFERCMVIRSSIAQIYNDQNTVSLDFLREASVSDRNAFLQRVPAVPAHAARFLHGVLSFEECVFSERSTLRVQTRLGLDPKSDAAQRFFRELRGMLAPYGHIPLRVGPDASDGKPQKKPELCPACLLVRLAPAKKR